MKIQIYVIEINIFFFLLNYIVHFHILAHHDCRKCNGQILPNICFCDIGQQCNNDAPRKEKCEISEIIIQVFVLLLAYRQHVSFFDQLAFVVCYPQSVLKGCPCLVSSYKSVNNETCIVKPFDVGIVINIVFNFLFAYSIRTVQSLRQMT